jgi:MFS family permease
MTSADAPEPAPGLRGLLAGERGRLVVGLLAAEFAAAFASIAETAVLPLASRELHGASLFGATAVGPMLSGVLLLVLGPTLTVRLGARRALVLSTITYVLGVLLACLAPTMVFVFVGRLIQGAAQGLVAGIGYSAIGSLYGDSQRRRVLSLFSVIWLLPSVLGPIVNSLVATFAGWRWAMAWPAVVFVGARILIGRSIDMVPVPESTARPPLAAGAVVLVGLALASVDSAFPHPTREIAWTVGLLVTLAGSWLVIRGFLGTDRARVVLVVVYGGLCAAYFGGESMLSLQVIDALGGTVVGAGIAYAGGAIAWSLFGFVTPGPRTRAVAAPVGIASVTAASIMLALVTGSGAQGVAPLIATTAIWVLAGIGIGLAFPVMAASGFDGEGGGDSIGIGAALAFAETTAIAFSGLLGAGFYSLTADSLRPSAGIGIGFALVAVVGVVALVGALTRRADAPGASPITPPGARGRGAGTSGRSGSTGS